MKRLIPILLFVLLAAGCFGEPIEHSVVEPPRIPNSLELSTEMPGWHPVKSTFNDSHPNFRDWVGSRPSESVHHTLIRSEDRFVIWLVVDVYQSEQIAEEDWRAYDPFTLAGRTSYGDQFVENAVFTSVAPVEDQVSYCVTAACYPRIWVTKGACNVYVAQVSSDDRETSMEGTRFIAAAEHLAHNAMDQFDCEG